MDSRRACGPAVMRYRSFPKRRQFRGRDQTSVVQMFGQFAQLVIVSKGSQIGKDVKYPSILHYQTAFGKVNETLTQP